MHRLLASLSLLCAVAMPLPALADTIATFELSAFHSDVYYGGAHSGTAGGTFTADITTGALQSVDFTFSGQGKRVKLDGSFFDVTPGGNIEIFEAYLSNPEHNGDFASMDIVIPVSTLIGYAGGPICTTTNPCNGGEFGIFSQGPAGRNYFIDGSFSPVDTSVSPVPEPSSLVLLGTGVLALLTTARHKLRNRA